jgi:hypothetical protein
MTASLMSWRAPAGPWRKALVPEGRAKPAPALLAWLKERLTGFGQ